MIALFGWEAMTAAERFAAIGGVAGFASVIVSGTIAWVNRRMMKKQLQISADANATAKLAVENQIATNEVTKRSVEDQLATSQLARTALVRIAEVAMCDRETAIENGDLAAIERVHPDADFAVLTLRLINEGMGPAYKIKLTPVAVRGRELTYHHNAGWRLLEEGENLWAALEPFASAPVGSFLSIPSGHVIEFRVAVQTEAFTLAAKGPYFGGTYRLDFEDGLGVHMQWFQFGVLGVGVGVSAKGWVSKVAVEETEHKQQ